jgi:hypothetical protein
MSLLGVLNDPVARSCRRAAGGALLWRSPLRGDSLPVLASEGFFANSP